MRIDKPWGHELIWAKTDKYVGKVLHIEAGTKLSLQYHRVKDEAIYVMSGRMELQIGSDSDAETVILEPGQYRRIAPGTVHRMVALTTCDVLEVSTPELDDVVRLADEYGRAQRSPSGV